MVELRPAEELAHQLEELSSRAPPGRCAAVVRGRRRPLRGRSAARAGDWHRGAAVPRHRDRSDRRRASPALVAAASRLPTTSAFRRPSAPPQTARVALHVRAVAAARSHAASASTPSRSASRARRDRQRRAARHSRGAIAFEFVVAAPLDEERVERVGGRRHRRRAASPSRPLPRRAVAPAWNAAGAGRRCTSRHALAPSHVVRVDLTRLDDLMRIVGDLVISRARLDDSLARVERTCPAGEWRAMQENAMAIERQLRDAARRHHARAPGAGRRDLPAHAVRRPRSGARDRQARPARVERAGHRDRQVPGRADDGSGAPSGPQRRQPRHRDGRRAHRGRQAARRHDLR